MSATSLAPPAALRRATLDRIRDRLAALPLLPFVLMRLLQLDRSAPDYFEQLRSLVRSDPGLAIRLLCHVNSAAVAAPAKVTSIERAMLLVGSNGVMRLALSFSAIRVFVPHLQWQKDLWRHAFDVAFLMEALAGHVQGTRLDPSHAYLLGLLHDLGRFVMYLEAPAEIMAVEETHWDSPQQLVEAETRLCGYTHAEVGYLALVKWQLSDALANQVRFHHGPAEGCGRLDEVDLALIGLLRDADILSIRLGLANPYFAGNSDAEWDVAIAAADLRCQFDIRPAMVRDCVRSALENSARIQKILGVAPVAA